MPHIVKAFGEELKGLADLLSKMGGMVEANLMGSIDALKRRDTDLAKQIIKTDKAIDALETEIEESAIRVLALRQPMADDFRVALSAIKISSDLERVGDFAKNIARRTLILNKEEPIKLTKRLTAMGRSTVTQVHNVLDAFAQRDVDKAVEVWRNDEDIDEMYTALFRELLTYMMEDPRTIGLCAHLLFIARNLERAGDHVTNIAESIHYMVDGTRLEDKRPKGDKTHKTAPPKAEG